MYHPLVPDASFIELHNTSLSNAFDLSNWRITGADCTIPEGTIIEPGAFLVFVKDRAVFATTYGSSIAIAGAFDGSLDRGGEALKLIKPGANPASDTIIDAVTYEDAAPWPAAADGSGASLQLIDPTQDNDRAANWAAATTNAPPPRRSGSSSPPKASPPLRFSTSISNPPATCISTTSRSSPAACRKRA